MNSSGPVVIKSRRYPGHRCNLGGGMARGVAGGSRGAARRSPAQPLLFRNELGLGGGRSGQESFSTRTRVGGSLREAYPHYTGGRGALQARPTHKAVASGALGSARLVSARQLWNGR